ncbi:PAS and ANTAR domain-containing protein [Pseudarthrobacter sp. ATCC 49987]|uniref:PAS and ANTAR domain-containing protein n=1 Tax=Pseudarthrobacter sp. ATCC 49987 TaxID=2698204 RepID=UPI00136A8EDD|nr:PAS and ANTAR domain-containing protein [Pseudarthrobacter sp. ATCC 49987]
MSTLDSMFTYSSALEPSACTAGAFLIDAVTGVIAWSDALYRIHGYQRGEVVPTVELVLAHKHPGDRAKIRELHAGMAEAGGHFSSYHRLIDSHQHEHRVLTTGEAVLDANGRLFSITGIMVDLTSTVHAETERAARDAVAGAVRARAVIERAVGILMGRLSIGADAAFSLLSVHSNHTNKKLAAIASQLVGLAEEPRNAAVLTAVIHDIQRHTPHATAVRRGTPSEGLA